MTQAPPRFTEVLEFLPQFQVASLKYLPGWEQGYVLSGTLRPFDTLGVEGVARLLAGNLSVYLTPEGSLATPEVLPLLTDIPNLAQVVGQEFKVEMWVRNDSSHPQFYMVQPRFTLLGYPGHPHPHPNFRPVQRDLPTQAACAYRPHAVEWDPETGQLIVPLTWGATWVAAHAIWEQTKVWLSAPTQHDYWALWQTYGNTDVRCMCGSKNKFRECCTPVRMLFRHRFGPEAA